MEYEKPEMEVLRFSEHVGTVDVVGASHVPLSDASGEWDFE